MSEYKYKRPSARRFERFIKEIIDSGEWEYSNGMGGMAEDAIAYLRKVEAMQKKIRSLETQIAAEYHMCLDTSYLINKIV